MTQNLTIKLTRDDGSVRTLSEIENEVFMALISYVEGNVAELADAMQVGRSTLYRKISDRELKAARRLSHERKIMRWFYKHEATAFVRGGMLFLEPPQRWMLWDMRIFLSCECGRK